MCESKASKPIIAAEDGQAIAKGGVACPFPWRLHNLLIAAADEGLEDVVAWAPHGRAFTVRQPKVFAEGIMKSFFSHAKYQSFQRQLNLYGFSRFNFGRDKGAYYHLGFVRGHRHLVRSMKRVKIKGGHARKTTKEEEPNFYDAVWKNHFKASYPTPSFKQLLSGSRVVSPRGEPKALVLKQVPRVPIVDHVPLTIPSYCMHAGNVSDDDNSDDSSSWEASVFDHLSCEEECLPVTIPPSVLQNCAIYDNPFEPTPIREPWMTTTMTMQSCSPFFWAGSAPVNF